MKEIVFKISIIALLLFNCVGCGCLKKQQNSSMYGYEYLFNQRQLDSMCFADNINPYIDEWFTTLFIDYETNQMVEKKMYIKELSKKKEAIYTLIQKDTLYLITKRIGKTE